MYMAQFDVTAPIDLIQTVITPSYAGPGFNGAVDLVAFSTNLSAAYPDSTLTIRLAISGEATAGKTSLSASKNGNALATFTLSATKGADFAAYIQSFTVPVNLQVVDYFSTSNTAGSASFVVTFPESILLASSVIYLSAFGTNFALVSDRSSVLDNLDQLIADGSAPAAARIRSVGGRARLVSHLG